MGLKEKLIEELRNEGYIVVLKEEFYKTVDKINEVIEPAVEKIIKEKQKQPAFSFSSYGRKKQFPKKEKRKKGELTPTEEKVLAAIESGCETKQEVVEKIKIPESTARSLISTLFLKKKIKKISYGHYCGLSQTVKEETKDEPIELTEGQKKYAGMKERLKTELLSALGNGKEWFGDLTHCCGKIGAFQNKNDVVKGVLNGLVAEGKVVRVSVGKYNLAKQKQDAQSTYNKINADDKLILTAIKDGYKTNKTIAKKTKLSYYKVNYRLSCLIKKELVVKTDFGHFDLPGTESRKEKGSSSFADKEAENSEEDEFEAEVMERD